MAEAINRDRQLLRADISFALLGGVSILGTFHEFFDETDAIAPATQPWLYGAIIVVLILVIGAVISKVAALDRGRSEEYTFQLLTQGAVVGIVTTMIVNVLWFDIFLGRWLGELSADHLLTTLMGGWAFGYYFHRLRGVAS